MRKRLKYSKKLKKKQRNINKEKKKSLENLFSFLEFYLCFVKKEEEEEKSFINC